LLNVNAARRRAAFFLTFICLFKQITEKSYVKPEFYNSIYMLIINALDGLTIFSVNQLKN